MMCNKIHLQHPSFLLNTLKAEFDRNLVTALVTALFSEWTISFNESAWRSLICGMPQGSLFPPFLLTSIVHEGRSSISIRLHVISMVILSSYTYHPKKKQLTILVLALQGSLKRSTTINTSFIFNMRLK